MTSKLHKTCIILTALLCPLLINGCSIKIRNAQIPTFTDYPRQQKHPLTIALQLNEDYSGYVWASKLHGEPFQTLLGEALEKNSIVIAEQNFDKVHIARGSKAEIPADAKAVLIPKVISLSGSSFISAFDNADLAIDVEWELQDISGNTIWLKTIRGKARNKAGNLFSMGTQADKRLQMAMKDLFKNSYQAISTSPLIRAFGVD